MGIQKTLGGDRLGSGNHMKQEMHDFYRSNKNLSTTFASTMAPGVLYPAYCNVALKGDTFDIDLNALVRTIPTQGPLYGSFKLQVDMFQVPFRLYQAILHNNTTDIARKMNQVYLPKVQLHARVEQGEVRTRYNDQIHTSALMRYLGMSGLGKPNLNENGIIVQGGNNIYRNVLAIPMLAYYDIFKNYYSNKQEENAYVITPEIREIQTIIEGYAVTNEEELPIIFENNSCNITLPNLQSLHLIGEHLNYEKIYITFSTQNSILSGSLKELQEQKKIKLEPTEDLNDTYDIYIIRSYSNEVKINISGENLQNNTDIKLQPFPLSNIDDMRKYLLTQWDLGTEVVISQTNQNYYPYAAVTGKTGNYDNNMFALNGLVVKCYQSDMFNNWLDSEWVNEITETSAIDVSNGSFTLDTLNFKKKLYDHLNRLAISGGTYDDWQEATYGDRVWGKSEKPIYCGGMSAEVNFDEVVSTAGTEQDPLGTIGGRGTLTTRKGGKVTIKVGEASLIMCMVSLTPRLFYTQGNQWFNTELSTMDDLHKPIFDRIGFQDLLVESMAWWDTSIAPSSIPQPGVTPTPGTIARNSAGKQPAWMQYATDVDRAYGDFANPNGTSFMILGRNYEQNANGGVKDITTYIDPRKFNYAFAYKELDAQNFWTFIKFNIHARRKMSNTQIPNV